MHVVRVPSKLAARHPARLEGLKGLVVKGQDQRAEVIKKA
jgi:hypothetical protein